MAPVSCYRAREDAGEPARETDEVPMTTTATPLFPGFFTQGLAESDPALFTAIGDELVRRVVGGVELFIQRHPDRAAVPVRDLHQAGVWIGARLCRLQAACAKAQQHPADERKRRPPAQSVFKTKIHIAN